MSVREILTSEAYCLHKPSTDVCFPLTEKELTIITNLKDTLNSSIGVFGISANQLGYMKNIVAIRVPKLTIMINPEIVIARAYTEEQFELCLSYPNKLYNVLRAEYIVVRYFDEHGNKYIQNFTGVFSTAIQHAIDHLRGLTIEDRGKRVSDSLTKKLYLEAGIPYTGKDSTKKTTKDFKSMDDLISDLLDNLENEDDEKDDDDNYEKEI